MNLLNIGLTIFSLILVSLNLALLWWLGWLLYPYFFGGGPFVVTSHERLKNMIKLAQITPKDIVVDLGSGDGRLVIEAARIGAKHAIGYEINPKLIKLSKKNAKKSHVEDRVTFERTNMWKTDLSKVDVVFIYQLPYVMKRIETKLLNELKPGSRVVTNSFVMPNWKFKEKFGTIYLYEKK